MQLYGAITKVMARDDGTIEVHGIASTPARDDVGETITSDAMRAAIPDYMKFGAVREMHTSSAAGKALQIGVEDDGKTAFSAHVVDPIAIKKVQAGVYKGFSVGGKVTRRDETDPSIITGIKLVEVSLVDRPANPESVINMWKAEMPEWAPAAADVRAKAVELAKAAGHAPTAFVDFLFKAKEELKADHLCAEQNEIEKREFTTDQRRAAAHSGAAMPDGSFPIENEGDLHNAIRAIGRAKDEAAAKKHIINRARAMGMTAALPDDWKSDCDMGADSQAIAVEETPDAKSLPETALAAALTKAQEASKGAAQSEEDVAKAASQAAFDLIMDAISTELVEKAGRRNSTADQARLQAAHDMLTKMGAVCDNDDDEHKEDAALADALTGKVADLEKAIADVTGERDSLQKAMADATPQVAGFADLFGKMQGEITDLRAQIVKLAAETIPPRTLAGARTVSKEADVQGPGANDNDTPVSPEAFQKALDALPEKERADILLRVALQNPRIVRMRAA